MLFLVLLDVQKFYLCETDYFMYFLKHKCILF